MNKQYNIVMFHYPCQDGLASAYIAHMYNHNIELYPIQHGISIDINRLKNKKVIMCDYSPSVEILDNIEKNVDSICILDHHISAQRDLTGKEYAIFDMTKSGAGLTWEHFFSEKEMPLWVQYIQDRDLWTWKLVDSRDFTAALFEACSQYKSENFTELFKIFDNLSNDNNISHYIKTGKELNYILDMKVDNIIDSNKNVYYYENYMIKIIECPYELVSEVGSKITKDNIIDFAALWRYNEKDNIYNVSLRANNKVDVSIIAKQFGGGGHMNAASFKSKDHPLDLF
jgi:oligoribonuclease NrnB/cAMP/cGMP phosphodiesterase (DHH superfamily)